MAAKHYWKWWRRFMNSCNEPKLKGRWLTSEGPNKQTLKFPSAKSRNLLHPAQKCSVIDVIKETAPACSSTLKFLAVSVGWSWSLFRPGNRFTCSRKISDLRYVLRGTQKSISRITGESSTLPLYPTFPSRVPVF